MEEMVNFELSQHYDWSGDPNVDSDSVIHYLELDKLPDNSRVVHEGTKGQFQTLIMDESDEITDQQLSQINLDKIEADHQLNGDQLDKQLCTSYFLGIILTKFLIHCQKQKCMWMLLRCMYSS